MATFHRAVPRRNAVVGARGTPTIIMATIGAPFSKVRPLGATAFKCRALRV